MVGVGVGNSGFSWLGITDGQAVLAEEGCKWRINGLNLRLLRLNAVNKFVISTLFAIYSLRFVNRGNECVYPNG